MSAYSQIRIASKEGTFLGAAAASRLGPGIWRYAVHLVSLVLIVFGWVVVLVGAFGTGIDVSVGNLDPLTTGIVLVLAGLTLRAAP
jgi:hypothetical protein